MPRPRRLLAASLRWLRGCWPLLLASAILAYFGYHAVHGQRGLLAWIDRNREIEAAKQELAQVEARRAALEQRIAGFRPGQLDRDLLEEELRRLGYIKKDEVIVLTPEQVPADGR